MARRCLLSLTCVVGISGGCDPSDASLDTFEAVFEETARVQLEESPDDPMVRIAAVQRRPGGGFIIADEAAHRVRLFGRSGRIEATLGRLGDGPGELDSPTGAVELEDGRVVVTQRANPELTVYEPGADPVVSEVPGFYGFWTSAVDDQVVVGVGSRDDRFAVLSPSGSVRATFGRVPGEVNEIPFWIFFASENAATVGSYIATNTSFYPVVRVFDSSGRAVDEFGTAPPSWIPPTAPPIGTISEPGDADRIAEWSSTFTVVRALAAVSDSLLVVQYGQHQPSSKERYYVAPIRIDVYDPSGAKVLENMSLTDPLVGGGAELLILVAEPPEPWTLSLVRWKGPPS